MKLLTAKDTRKEGLTVVLVFKAPPGDRIAMLHFWRHGLAVAAYTRGAVNGIATRAIVNASAINVSCLRFRIFPSFHTEV